VKTKIQTNPTEYPGEISALTKVWKQEGPSTLYTGWLPTFLGFFVNGGVCYTLTELFRRLLTNYITDMSGIQVAATYEVPIVVVASAAAAFLGAGPVAPFEAVRIRTVAQPNFAPNLAGVVTRIVSEEGFLSLFDAVPAFLLKDVPFAIAKFTVFDISTARLYEAFPTAREDLRLSLLISLIGGTLGGITASVVSNPADVTISEMKKTKGGLNPLQAATIVLERSGPVGLLRGLGLRMFFYSVLVSLQFLVYDAIRFALGIGADDLKVYLDVLGAALEESGGPV